jgi:serine/threonine protein kinase
MLTGELPFGADKDRAALRSVASEASGVPVTLDQIVKHALKKDRDLRYQTFADLRSDLKVLLRDSQTGSFDHVFTNETFLQTDPAGSRPPSTRSNSEFGRRSPYAAMWLIAPILFLGLAAGAYWKYFYAVAGPSVNPFQSTKLDILTAHGLAGVAAISPNGQCR